jgi:arabinoxylan arabinofuranohydrolase
MTKTGPDAVAALNPYEKVSAATINWCEGVLTQRKEPDNRSNLEMCIFGIHNNSYVKIKNVDFGTKGPAEFKATISCGNNNGDIRLELRIGDINGKLIGALQVAFTGGWDEWAEQSLSVENIHGVQDLYLVFKSGSHDELVRICDWQFF